MKGKKVLVTGGAGFIGSHLVDRLVDESCQVVVVDDLSSGSLENIRSHLTSRRVRFLEGDVCSSEAVEKAVKVDLVCHFGGCGERAVFGAGTLDEILVVRDSFTLKGYHWRL